MATGTASGFKIYNEEFYAGVTETLEQETNVFNQASLGSVRLVSRNLKGDYEKESFIKSISSLVNRRDTASVTTVSDSAVTMDENIGVKLNRRLGPVANTLDSWRKIAKDEREMSLLIGQQFGKAMAADMVNSAMLALDAALSGVTALNYAGTSSLDHTTLVNGLSKFGDAGSRIVAWVMHSKPYYDLMKSTIANNVFNVAGVTIVQGSVASLGRPIIVTDSDSLYNSTTSENYRVLGLVSNAVEVAESEDRNIVSEVITGLENLIFRIQGEAAYNVKVRGFKWDTANGGANPTNAAVGTASNWDSSATDRRSQAGVRIHNLA